MWTKKIRYLVEKEIQLTKELKLLICPSIDLNIYYKNKSVTIRLSATELGSECVCHGDISSSCSCALGKKKWTVLIKNLQMEASFHFHTKQIHRRKCIILIKLYLCKEVQNEIHRLYRYIQKHYQQQIIYRITD